MRYYALALILLWSTQMDAQFRKTSWGMSKDQVKNAEGLNVNCDVNDFCIIENQKLSTFDVTIVYVFEKGQLVRGGYEITESHINNNLYIDDYNKIEDILTSKYGKPQRGGLIWSDDTLKEYVETGDNIAMGNCKYNHGYYTSDINILHVLKGDNFNVTHLLMYYDPTYTEKEDTTGF